MDSPRLTPCNGIFLAFASMTIVDEHVVAQLLMRPGQDTLRKYMGTWLSADDVLSKAEEAKLGAACACMRSEHN